MFARNQVINYYSTFKPVDIEEIRTELWAYGNGRIDFKTENNIGIIKLNYPEKKNAISGRMMSEFYDLMTNIEKGYYPMVKGLILTAEGDFFCAGGGWRTFQPRTLQPQASTLDFSTPGLFNHELFNHEFLNYGVEKFMVEQSGVEKFIPAKNTKSY